MIYDIKNNPKNLTSIETIIVYLQRHNNDDK
jgi:hypothetical protein